MCTDCGCSSFEFREQPREPWDHRVDSFSGSTRTLAGLEEIESNDPIELAIRSRAKSKSLFTQEQAVPKKISVEVDLLAKNNRLAELNRSRFKENQILALNLVSSPGSGKTTLLERTITDLRRKFSIHVIEGDQETANDAERIRATGCPVVQINTGTGCHLDAQMVADGLKSLAPPQDSVVMIENVGNLVCPALFDLGESAKVAILSVTEGEDKPLKYPHMFRASQLMILNKVDLLPYVSFDVEKCKAFARQVNPHIEILEVSATRGDGLEGWYRWIQDRRIENRLTDSRQELTREQSDPASSASRRPHDDRAGIFSHH